MEREFEKKLAAQRLFQKYGEMEIINQVQDTKLEGRWHILRSLGEGAFGKIFHAIDLKKTTQGVPRPVIVKFTRNHEMNDREYRALKDVVRYVKKQRGENPFYASTHSKGKVIINDKNFYAADKDYHKEQDPDAKIERQIWSYIVQEKLGDTMENYLFERNEPFTEKTVLQIGIQLLDSFRMIHEAGYTYNDLKLDNVLIGDDKDLPNAKSSLYKCRLIDFGLAKKYLQEDGSHIPLKKEKLFQGNLIFASVNTFNMITHSRRDDLISLCYFMLYLVDGDLAFLKREDEDNEEMQGWKQEEFSRIQHLKNTLTPEKICESEEGQRLLPFVKEVFSLQFEDKPDYEKLRFYLVKILLDINEAPSTEYDWNIGIPQKDNTRKVKNHRPQGQDQNEEDVDFSMDTNEAPDVSMLMENNNDLRKQVSLDDKMKGMHGYVFNFNKNADAMQKVLNSGDPELIKQVLQYQNMNNISDGISNGGVSAQSLQTDNIRQQQQEMMMKMQQQQMQGQMDANMEAQRLQQIQYLQQFIAQNQNNPQQQQEAIKQLNMLMNCGPPMQQMQGSNFQQHQQ